MGAFHCGQHGVKALPAVRRMNRNPDDGFFVCFQPNSETTESGWFPENALPELAEEKTTAEQVRMCFAACRDENWKVLFD